MSNTLDLTGEQWNSLNFWKGWATEREQRRIAELLLGRSLPPSPLERFCPHEPWPKQREFLELAGLEAFYGGAAAGGKSEALLMAALQYVDVPGYAALILRRDTQRLKLAGGLIPRSQQWFAGRGPTWHGTERRWTFPTGGAPATISFGYLRDATDKFRYGSSEYQFIAFDELTEFPEDDYLFLFSRLRKTTSLPVPLRMRAASNPGNVGHAWVKRRFIDSHSSDDRTYIPARIADNPAVNEVEYCRSLSHLPALERERLMNGDWTVQAAGLVRRAWLRDYDEANGRLRLVEADGRELASFEENECRTFITIDPAGTSAERAAEHRGRPASWSAMTVWQQPLGRHSRFLLLREVMRRRVGFDGLCEMLRQAHRQWRPQRMLIENEKLGQAAVDLLGRELPLVAVATGGRDKVARAAPLLLKLERGEIWLPRAASAWRETFESELLTWTGLPEETSDQIDAAAYAVREAEEHVGPLRMERVFL